MVEPPRPWARYGKIEEEIIVDGNTVIFKNPNIGPKLRDALFMTACWRKIQKRQDKSECNTCDLRFKCYTENWDNG